MNTKGKFLFLGLLWALILVVSPALPQMQIEVLAADETIKVEDEQFYKALKEGLSSTPTVKCDDQNLTITLDMASITRINIQKSVKMTQNDKDILEKLFKNCTNLDFLCIRYCNLEGVKFSALNDRGSLKRMYLLNTGLKEVPDVKLPNLTVLCMSGNDLSATDSCSHLTAVNFPKLTSLWLDSCKIEKLRFPKNIPGGVFDLSLAYNGLGDDSIETLLGMKEKLSNLKELSFGTDDHVYRRDSSGQWGDGVEGTGRINTNRFANPGNLALIPHRFEKLKTLDLSDVGLTSLQAFADAGLRNGIGITIYLERNSISDLAGLKREQFFTNDANTKIFLFEQRFSFSGEFAPGYESEIPELIKNILDENHPLHGALGYVKCRLSADGKRIFIEPGAKEAYVRVKDVNGKHPILYDSIIRFELKKVPSYIIPQGLTATEGDTLAKVSLPEGFAWKDPALSVGAAGTKSFKAVYTPADTAKYIVVEIDIPVTVKKAVTEPIDKTPEPATVEPTPMSPEPEPEQDDRPDESNLTGNQIDDRKDLSLLLATGKQKGKNGIELTWKKKNGCSGYEVYWSYCDGKRNYKKAKTVKSTGNRSYTHKNLKKNRAYKYYIATYKIKGGKKFYQSKSPVIHVAMSQEKSTNVKSISVNKAKVSLKEKKTFQIKATAKAENKKKKILAHADKFRYYTNDKKVATVTKKGKIQAKKKGSCSIFVIANNGVSKEIKVTVK